MKKLLFLLIVLVSSLYSCNPASNANLWKDTKGCTWLSNQSASQKITFTLQFPLSKNKDSSEYVYKFEQTLGPKMDVELGCEGINYEIIGAYVKGE